MGNCLKLKGHQKADQGQKVQITSWENNQLLSIEEIALPADISFSDTTFLKRPDIKKKPTLGSLCRESVQIITSQSSKISNHKNRIAISAISSERSKYKNELNEILDRREKEHDKVSEMVRSIKLLKSEIQRGSHRTLSSLENRGSIFLSEPPVVNFRVHNRCGCCSNLERTSRRHFGDEFRRGKSDKEQLDMNLLTIGENEATLREKFEDYQDAIENLDLKMVEIIRISQRIDIFESEIDYYKRMIKQELEVLKSNK